VSPIFTILMTLALPVAHVCIYYQFHDLYAAKYAILFSSTSRYRNFCYISASMAEKYGFDLSAPLNALTFPFVQTSGGMALSSAFLLFIPLAAVERRIGQARFIGLFFAFVAVSSLAQAFFAILGLTTGYLCGIVPIAIGFLTYTSYAWPDLRIRDRIGLMSVYSGIVGLFLLAFPMLNALALDFLSCGVGPIAACLALGAILGRRSRKLRCTAL
jgi:membrane associated rhomboid family serine protease